MQKRARTAQAKQDRANAILDKARQMLLTTGYDRIKMADLAGALGLSSGTLYVYFQNKETLFLHLLRRDVWRDHTGVGITGHQLNQDEDNDGDP